MGWGKDSDETISDFTRFDTGTNVVKFKAWVKLPDASFGLWPGVVYARYPVLGDEAAMAFLKQEKRLLVVPCGATQSNELNAFSFGG
jgi:hypothetical protein